MANQADVPDRKQIAKLPRWFRVAFAARCARRVMPIYATSKIARARDVQALERGIQSAEAAAAGYADFAANNNGAENAYSAAKEYAAFTYAYSAAPGLWTW